MYQKNKGLFCIEIGILLFSDKKMGLNERFPTILTCPYWVVGELSLKNDLKRSKSASDTCLHHPIRL
jgi:hypothetical protein